MSTRKTVILTVVMMVDDQTGDTQVSHSVTSDGKQIPNVALGVVMAGGTSGRFITGVNTLADAYALAGQMVAAGQGAQDNVVMSLLRVAERDDAQEPEEAEAEQPALVTNAA